MISISRIYGKVLKTKIEREYADYEAEEQAGFRAGTSTVDHLFFVTLRQDVGSQQGDALSVCRPEEGLQQRATGEVVGSFTFNKPKYEYYKSRKKSVRKLPIKIKVPDNILSGFDPNEGLKPTLFKIYLEKVLMIWKQKCLNMGIPLNHYTMYTLNFTNNEIVIAQDTDDIKYMTRERIRRNTRSDDLK